MIGGTESNDVWEVSGRQNTTLQCDYFFFGSYKLHMLASMNSFEELYCWLQLRLGIKKNTQKNDMCTEILRQHI